MKTFLALVGSLLLLALSLCDAAQKNTKDNNVRRRPRRKLGLLDKALGMLHDVFYGPTFDDPPQSPTGPTVDGVGQEYYDVVIVGAGVAGLAAAAEIKAIDPDATYVILESTNRIGGRVRSTTFGAAGQEFTVEDGANWLYNNNDYPTWQLAQDLGIQSFLNNYQDFTMYNESGAPVPSATSQARLNVFLNSFRNAERDADNEFEDTEQPGFVDKGVVGLLNQNGWTVAPDASGNMDYIYQWLYLDFEYAQKDTSQRFFPYESSDPYLVVDQRGYEFLVQTFQANNIPSDLVRLNTRVRAINYDQNICPAGRIALCCQGTTYRAIVNTDATEYFAQRVINTVSVGVHNSNQILYNPPLKYPPETSNPYEMVQYIKVFFQFSTKFWDSTQFVYVIRDVANRGKCHHWQDMDTEIPGSGIIRCELMNEAFLDLIDADTQELSAATLNSLLDPLRLAYGTATVGTPLAVYYPKLNKDADYGYGAYGNWQVGRTFTEFARFFGGLEELADNCDHNGCNAIGDWILHFSGAASCYEHAEFVHGAWFSGQRSARFVMDSLGVEGVETDNSECDVSFPFLGFSPFVGVQRNGGRKARN